MRESTASPLQLSSSMRSYRAAVFVHAWQQHCIHDAAACAVLLEQAQAVEHRSLNGLLDACSLIIWSGRRLQMVASYPNGASLAMKSCVPCLPSRKAITTSARLHIAGAAQTLLCSKKDFEAVMSLCNNCHLQCTAVTALNTHLLV